MFLEVFIPKALEVRFLEVGILKELASGDALADSQSCACCTSLW